MYTTYFLALHLMLLLAPSSDPIARHGQLATAISAVVSEEGPLFRNESGEKTIALLVSIAFRESSLRNDVEGDHGHSVCAMQIYDGPKELKEDPALCIRTGYRMLKESFRISPSHPVAFYARGPRYESAEAKRISDDRIALARRLLMMYIEEERKP